MRSVHILIVFAELLVISLRSAALSSDAYPSGYGDELGTCVGIGDTISSPLRREVYDNGEIIDITHRFTPNTPVGSSTEGVGRFLTLLESMKNGSDYNFSEMKLPVHSGTHVDAPGHMYDNYFDEGYDVDTLDLRVLNGIDIYEFNFLIYLIIGVDVSFCVFEQVQRCLLMFQEIRI